MSDLNIHNLFPTPVAFFKYNKELTTKQLDFFLNQEKRTNMGNTNSANQKILNNPKVKDIASFIQVSVDQYFEEVWKPKHDTSLRITQSWLNYTDPGQFHHKHAHPNSFVSGVFYVDADPTHDKIYFFNEGYQTLSVEHREYNIWNSKSWWFPVEKGLLVLFPSSFTHMVETVTAETTRISLALNTFPKGYMGNDDNLTGLHL